MNTDPTAEDVRRLREALTDIHVEMRAWWDAYRFDIEDAHCRRALAILEEVNGTTMPKSSHAVLSERERGAQIAASALAEVVARKGSIEAERVARAIEGRIRSGEVPL